MKFRTNFYVMYYLIYILIIIIFTSSAHTREADTLYLKEEMINKYISIFKQEDKWVNGFPIYCEEGIPIEGDEENRTFLTKTWKFPYEGGDIFYEKGNCEYEIYKYLVSSGKNIKEVCYFLVKEYGVTSAIIEIAKDNISIHEMKSLVWLKNVRASEYFLWKYHASLDPVITNDEKNVFSDLIKDKKISIHKIYKEICDLEKNSESLNNSLKLTHKYSHFNFSVASYLRRFYSIKDIELYQKELYKELIEKYGKTAMNLK